MINNVQNLECIACGEVYSVNVWDVEWDPEDGVGNTNDASYLCKAWDGNRERGSWQHIFRMPKSVRKMMWEDL